MLLEVHSSVRGQGYEHRWDGDAIWEILTNRGRGSGVVSGVQQWDGEGEGKGKEHIYNEDGEGGRGHSRVEIRRGEGLCGVEAWVERVKGLEENYM